MICQLDILDQYLVLVLDIDSLVSSQQTRNKNKNIKSRNALKKIDYCTYPTDQ